VARIVLRANRHVVHCTSRRCERLQSIVLSGQLLGARRPGGVLVQIHAYSAAYNASLLIRAHTNSRGQFRARFQPTCNLRLVARVAAGQSVSSSSSRTLEVIAIPNEYVRETDQALGNGPQANLILRAYAPVGPLGVRASHVGSARFAYIYASRDVTGRYYKIARLRVVGLSSDDGDVSYLAQAEIAPTGLLAESHYLTSCAHGLIFRGVGAGYSRCGRPVITVGR
jgi:hypothetical protein